VIPAFPRAAIATLAALLAFTAPARFYRSPPTSPSKSPSPLAGRERPMRALPEDLRDREIPNGRRPIAELVARGPFGWEG